MLLIPDLLGKINLTPGFHFFGSVYYMYSSFITPSTAPGSGQQCSLQTQVVFSRENPVNYRSLMFQRCAFSSHTNQYFPSRIKMLGFVTSLTGRAVC